MPLPLPRTSTRWVTVDGRRHSPVYLVVADEAEGEAWWRVTDLREMEDGRLTEHRIGPPLRVFTRCEPDGRIRQPVEQRALRVEQPPWGYRRELLVEQIEPAVAWEPRAAAPAGT